MKILVLSQYFWPENFIINDLVEQLVAQGHDVSVLTGRPSYPDRSRFSTFWKTRPSQEKFHGASVLRVPLLPRGKGFRLALNYLSFALSASTIGLWRLRGRRFDVIFVFQPSPLSIMLPAAIMRQMFRAPAVLWVLDLWPETIISMGILSGRMQIKFAHWLSRVAYEQADYIFAQSRRMTKELKGRAVDKTKVDYLPNWTVGDIHQHSVGAAPTWKDDRFTIVMAGNMGDAQDFPSILDAIELVAAQVSVHWVFIGDGLRKDWFAQQIDERGLQGTVSLVCRVPRETVGKHLEAADALLVSLTNDEVFSLTVPARLQAYLSAGRPILGMINGEAANLIDEAGAGIAVCAGCPRDLARAVGTLMGMTPAERAKMGRSGIAFEQKMFNRENWIKHLSQKLAECCRLGP